MQEDNSTNRYDSVIASCPLLFSQYDEQSRCGYIACGQGWHEPIKQLCNRLENLNLLYRDRHVTIIAMQVKEKFGELRFYYTIVVRQNIFARAAKYLRKRCSVDYGMHIQFINASAVSRPTKHVKLWYVMNFHKRISKAVFGTPKYRSKSQPKFITDLYIQVNTLIDAAEAACYTRCEHCGRQIGTSETPRITTKPWISYICTSCEKARKRENASKNVVIDRIISNSNAIN